MVWCYEESLQAHPHQVKHQLLYLVWIAIVIDEVRNLEHN